MASQSSTTSGGVGVLGLLGVLFVALKLLGVIDWSWWWVTLPFWGGIALVLALAAIYLLIAAVLAVIDERRITKR